MAGVSYEYLFKVVLVGDTGVGKTNLISRYMDDRFDPNERQTIGVDMATTCVQVHGHTIKAQIWDTAGQDRYGSIVPTYYKHALGAILVYNITETQSFQNARRWLNDIQKYANRDMMVLLVGNKTDLEELRVVPMEEAKEFAVENGLSFIETSALNNDNVRTAFSKILMDIYEHNYGRNAVLQAEEVEWPPITLDNRPTDSTRRRKKCCFNS
ncbi:hypothetical protein L596_010341 [Steinernema carpocapsae]|uniref:Ras-related protein Rab-11A n=1 Tax=Steinernema carpocapsae TaxID=34508 RepID=A0A4U5PI20_STECR|nr:hypothetical protein L596_010341 [Steinernema carpocapsae]